MMSGFAKFVTRDKWNMWSIFTALYRHGRRGKEDGEVDERDHGGVARDGGQGEGGMCGR